MTHSIEKPEILSRLNYDSHAIIEASAGTGKTYTLEHIVLDLLITSKATLAEILVVTFTEKAALELRNRIRNLIKNALSPSLHSSSKSSWVIDNNAISNLKRALIDFDLAPIYTIHGFCQRLLKEHAFLYGISHNQELLDSYHIFENAFHMALHQIFQTQEPYSLLLQAFLSENKLTTLQTLLHQIRNDHRFQTSAITPEQFSTIASAFNKHLSSLSEREILSLYSEFPLYKNDQERLPVLLGFLKKHHHNPYYLLTNAGNQALQLLTNPRIKKSSSEATSFPHSLPQHMKDLLHSATNVLNQDVNLEQCCVTSFLPILNQKIQQQKIQQDIYEYDDMLAIVAHNVIHNQQHRNYIQHQYKYGIIDEFQDTDSTQWSIFSNIFSHQDTHKLIIIGDPKQSIYAFRNADIHVYFQAKHVLQYQQQVELVTNYRSTQAVINVINELFAQEHMPFFTGGYTHCSKLRCGRPNKKLFNKQQITQPGCVIYEMPQAEEKLSIAQVKDLQAQFITSEIQSLLTYTVAKDESARSIDYQDMFILTNTNTEAIEISTHLEQNHIPFQLLSLNNPFFSHEAIELYYLLRAIQSPYKPAKLVLLGPLWGYALHEVPTTIPAEHPLLHYLYNWHSLVSSNSILEMLIDVKTFIRQQTEKQSIAEHPYLHVISILIQIAATQGLSYAALLDYFHAVMHEQQSIPEELLIDKEKQQQTNAVQIMTIHKSKGLEAEVVFIFGGYTKRSDNLVHRYFHDNRSKLHIGPHNTIPSQLLPLIEQERVQEEQRLLYVALTRTGSMLYLPFYPEQSLKRRLSGVYAQLNHQLTKLIDSNIITETMKDTFQFITINPQQISKKPQPNTFTLAPGQQKTISVAFLSEMLQHVSTNFIGSYSRLRNIDTKEQQLPNPPKLTIASNNSEPKGTEFGILMHDLLEHMPWKTLLDVDSMQDWISIPTVHQWLYNTIQHYQFSGDLVPYCAQQLFTSLKKELPQKEHSQVLPSLQYMENKQAEVEFYYSLNAKKSHTQYFIKGFLDITFTYKNKLYVADWKTDFLEDYAPATLKNHIIKNYRHQYFLYLLALSKLKHCQSSLDYANHIGGMYYIFLRSTQAVEGIFHIHPSYDELKAFEESLIDVLSLKL